MSVIRYHPSSSGGMCEADYGSYVRIEDYEFLEARIAYIEAGERARQAEETRQAIRRAEDAEKRS